MGLSRDIDRSNRKASGRAGTESDDGSAGDRTGIFSQGCTGDIGIRK